MIEPEGPAELADISAQGRADVPVEQVYAVRFQARDLWGEGDHHVVLDQVLVGPGPRDDPRPARR